MQSRRYPKDRPVFNQGDPVRAVFLVAKGEVRLTRFGPRGEEVILQRARRGDYFAEAALDSGRYHCNAIAAEPSELLEIPAAVLRDLLDRDAAFACQWATLLARQLRTTRARLERMALHGAADRLRHYLATEGSGPRNEVRLGGSLKDLARELGVAHETLYRTLARMEQSGYVERDGARLRLSAARRRV
ncbi:MAG TPA: Crp/Fnr family transcriptional regulator [Burkholderiales bacterium]|nr:Crp/Fnr family transcriptional regulator [Burkholderiales bacterium]